MTPTGPERADASAKHDASSHRTVRFEVAPKTIALVLLAMASVWLFLRLVPVLLVLVVALFLVGTLNPVVEWLEARGVKRRAGIAIVFVSVFATVVVVFAITLPPLVTQATNMLEHAPALRDKAVTVLARSRLTFPLAMSLHNFRGIQIADGAAALEYSYRVASLIGYGVTAIFLSLYLMLDRDRVRGALFAAVSRHHHIRLSRILIKLETIVGGYIRGQVVTSALMTSFTFVLLTIAGVEGAIALAVFAGVADVLPYIGVFLSVGPAVFATASHGLAWTLVVLGAMLTYEEFESRFLVPRIYGRALRLPSSVVILALLAGGTIGGIFGALLALPVAAAIRMLVKEMSPEMPGEAEANTGIREYDQRAQSEYELRSDGMDARHAAAVAVEISARGARSWGSMTPQ
ncbi:MAG TPA: AI-2E family transporter [Polyangiaceae bacterium]|nr:AI-2E family transporter [Polyangiaceae bacterium]